jgi:hypothetical protein
VTCDTDASEGTAGAVGGRFTAGTGSAQNTGAVSSSGGGASGAGNGTRIVPDAGTEPDAEPADASELGISVEKPDALCSGQPLVLRLTVSGGRPRYDWSLVGEARGFSLDAVEGRTVDVLTTPEAGRQDVVVEVRDADGQRGRLSLPLSIHSTPVLTTTTLVNACVGADYAATLAVEGGDASAYTFSADGGFTTDGSTLLGTPNALGKHTIHVTVSDGTCSSSSSLTLDVDDSVAGNCPELRQATPPPPCAGEPYRSEFVVAGGKPPLVWAAVSIPPGLEFDVENGIGVLSGTATGGGTFTLRVQDAALRTTQESYALPLRQSCWLAFVSPTGLGLADPLFPADQKQIAQDATIRDFAFSPDGRFIAYRSTTAGQDRVHVLAAPEWSELPFALTGSVASYAWSPDSRTLATALTRQGSTYLGGVRLVDTADSGSSAWSAEPLVVTTAGVGTTSLFTDVKWLDANTVTYLGPEDTEELGASYAAWYARLDTDGFGAPQEPAPSPSTPPATQMIAGTGFYVAGWGDDAITYFAVGGQDFSTGYYPSLLHTPDLLPDPEGKYVAAIVNHGLELLTTLEHSPNHPFTPLGSTLPCDSVLAWASGKERLACYYRDGDAGPEARLALYDADGGDVSRLDVASVEPGLPYGATEAHRAAFSRTGLYLGLTTSSAFYLVVAGDGSPRVTLQVPFATSPYTELAFAPDEKSFLYQAGKTLYAATSDAVVPQLLITNDAVTEGRPCRSDFLPPQMQESAKVPDSPWCGGADVTMDAHFSSDARAVATHTGDGITSWDLTKLHQGRLDDAGTVVCAKCVGAFSFQP